MDKFIESDGVELKEKFNDKFVKEVVAFLNTNGGKIFIGVTDDGFAVGVKNIDETMRKISDVLTTQIEPQPEDEVDIRVVFAEGKSVLALDIKKGKFSLYCIKKYGYSASGCLVRVGTTCREMTDQQIHRRYQQRFFNSDILSSSTSSRQDLTFNVLRPLYVEKGFILHDETFAKNLGLLTDEGKYNVMAELLSDQNRFSFIFVKFAGEDKSAISQRSDYGRKSILFGYEQMMNRISAENICLSDTTVRPRVDTYCYDYDSVNEAVVNAIVHNDWSISEPQVSFFSNRIEILSHGGLPYNLSLEDFFAGVSRPRNEKLMRIFSDLDIVDHTGHGIPIIVKRYGKNAFEITDSHIIVTIPFDEKVAVSLNAHLNVGTNGGLRAKDTAFTVLSEIRKNPSSTAEEIACNIGKSKKTVERYFSALQKEGAILRVGSKKNGHWKVVK